MRLNSTPSRDWKVNVRTLYGIFSLFVVVLILPRPVAAIQIALVRTTDGSVHQIRFQNINVDDNQGAYDVRDFVGDFHIYNQAGDVELCPGNDNPVTWELYTAARVLAQTRPNTPLYNTSALATALTKAMADPELAPETIADKIFYDEVKSQIQSYTFLSKISLIPKSSPVAVIAFPANIVAKLGIAEIKMRKLLYAFWIASTHANTAIALQEIANQEAKRLWDAINAGRIVDFAGGDLDVDIATQQISGGMSIDGPLRLKLMAEVYQENAERAAELGADLGKSDEAWDHWLIGLTGIGAFLELITSPIDVHVLKSDLERLESSIGLRHAAKVTGNIENIYTSADFSLNWHGFCEPDLRFVGQHTTYEGYDFTYTVALNSPPDGIATISISSDNPDATVSPEILTFTANDWFKPKTVRVSTVEDADTLTDTVYLTHTATGYGDFRPQRLSTTIKDRRGNEFPQPMGTLGPLTLALGDELRINLSDYFHDPDGDRLIYSASDEGSEVLDVTPDRTGSWITIRAREIGRARVVAWAIDTGDLETQRFFTVTVTAETWMPDANLRAAVRKALSLAPGDALTQEAMRGLVFLEASVPLDAAPSEKIRDLTGLEHAMQLAVLSLRHNKVVDVSVVSGLTQLILLDIRGNEVVDASPLSDLTQLTELSLDGNPITDFAPLHRLKAKNPDVEIDIDISIDVTAVPEETWMPDANLRAAVREALGLAPGDVLTKEAIQGLTELNALAAFDAAASEKIKDLTGLEYATQLTELSLGSNEIVDVSALSGLTQLTELNLGWNKIVDISALGPLTQLKTLFLWANFRISDISALAGLTQLKTLMLNGNAISNISALSGLTQLTKLDLVGGRISNISALSDLTQLTLLRLGSNEIVDVSPLSGLMQLTELSLSGNEIVDVSALSGLVQLKGLDLRDNAIVDVSALEGLINLERLRLEGNPIADLAPLRRLKAKNRDVDIDIDINALTTAMSEETWMPDANLRAAVRKALGLAPGDVLTQEAMQGLTKLDASLSPYTETSLKIKNLMGLEYATQLTGLYLGDNEIVDVSPLSGLTHLTDLHLVGNKIVDLSPLSGLTHLTDLHLVGNKIVDLSPLSGLTHLTRLYLGGVKVIGMDPLSISDFSQFLIYYKNGSVDLSPLSSLTQLITLYLGYGNLSDLNALSSLRQLRELYLVPGASGRNKINDVSPLSGLTQLKVLYLSDNEIVDVSALSGLTQLRELDLEGSGIVDASPLSGLTQLTKLYLGGNEIVDVSPLSSLRQLRELSLWGNEIVDISPLSGLTPLTRLDLQHNDIIDLSPLSGLTQLTALILSVNDIVNVSPLSGLTQLTTLYLSVNDIVNVSPLSGLTQLTKLYLGGNEIVDISPLSAMTKLTRLDLGRNEIVDVSPLSGMTKLTRLDLGRNEIADVSALEDLINLHILNLAENPISDLAPLRRLKSKNSGVNIDIDINADAPAAPAAPTLSVETALLSNYPNPFNPETWMPYQLSKPADVIVSIYSVDGKLVRTLVLGHQSAGVYQRKSRAAYWDGRNNVGERVASSVYFYTLTAGDFTATRKMLIRK